MNRSVNLLIVLGLSFTSAAFGTEPVAPTHTPPDSVNPLGLAIDHGSIGVADLDKMSEWYQRVLGFVPQPRVVRADLPGGAQYNVQRLSLPGYYLNLLQQKGSVRAPGLMDVDRQGLISMTFGTPDAEAVYQRLVAQGVTVLRSTKDAQGRAKSMHFTDPEGNHLEVSQR